MSKRDVTDEMSTDGGEVSELSSAKSFQMTPFLALVVSLIYMLSADGEIDDHESSQLQAVVGDHADLLEIAVDYAQNTDVSEFLLEAKDVLNIADKLCILCNLCDSLLSDGISEDHELEFFSLISDSFGMSQASFHPHFTNLKIKNDKQTLGVFNTQSLSLSGQSAHLPLACCLLYMMAADGNIADEEIGQLQVVIGEFEGLQAAAMMNVRSVKMNVFLKQASPLLSQDQKIYILCNVADSMMSDGKIDIVEDNLFQSILIAFAVSMPVFQIFYDTIRIKNIKPFDTNHIPTAFHSRIASKNKDSPTATFKVRHQNKSKTTTSHVSGSQSKQEGDWVTTVDQKELSAVVIRTMQDNIKQANESFTKQSDVDNVKNNAISNSSNAPLPQSATDKQNVLRIPVDVNDKNIQKADEEISASKNLKIDGHSETANIQQIGVSAQADNRQKTSATKPNINKQQLEKQDQSVNRQAAADSDIVDHSTSVNKSVLIDKRSAVDQPSINDTFSRGTAILRSNLQNTTALDIASSNLKLIKPEEVANLHKKIDDVHTQLNKLMPGKAAVISKNTFTDLVLNTRLPMDDQLRQSEKTHAIHISSDGIFDPKDALFTQFSQSLGETSLHVNDDVLSIRQDLYDDNENELFLSAEEANICDADVIYLNSVGIPQEDFPESQTTTLLADTLTENGGFDWRILSLMIFIICMPLGILARGIIYPSQTCQGLGLQERKWMPQKGGVDSVVLNEQSQPMSHSIKFSQTQVWVDGQRFPFYKELNQTSHFAVATPGGIKGNFSSQGIETMRYAFEYDNQSQLLRIDVQSFGMSSIDGQDGLIQENSSFLGKCASQWF